MPLPRSGPLAALLVALPLAAVAVGSALLAVPEPAHEAEEARGDGPRPGEPESFTFVALGDSITRAAGAKGFGDHADLSWATGGSARVDSVAARLEDALAPRPVRALNLAESGARASDLPSQARLAAQSKPDLVTVLVGSNDACAAGPLDEAAFRAHVREALGALPPEATVIVFAVPDIARLTKAWRGDPGALGTWGAFGTCPAILGRGADADASEDRVARLNEILREEVAYANNGSASIARNASVVPSERAPHDAPAPPTGHVPVARDERAPKDAPAPPTGHVPVARDERAPSVVYANSTASPDFGRGDVSTWDFFHPSVAGQARLAEVAWPVVERQAARWSAPPGR